jgi:hypothetical protein
MSVCRVLDLARWNASGVTQLRACKRQERVARIGDGAAALVDWLHAIEALKWAPSDMKSTMCASDDAPVMTSSNPL